MALPTPDPGLMARLAGHRSLGSVPTAELAWLATHGHVRSLAVGEVLTRKGEFAEHLDIFLSGVVAIHVDRGVGSHKLFEWRGGDVGGVLPYSRGARPPADAVAEEPTEVLCLPAGCLPDMTRECPTVTTTLVHAMVDRARQFNAADLRDEKLLSLGRLAAGLAHELNNPASAAVRSAKLLEGQIDAAELAATSVAATGMSDLELAAVKEVQALAATPAAEADRSPVARADREDAIATWLSDHGVDDVCADPLADTALTLETLDRLAATVRGDALDATLRWIAACFQVRALASEIQLATSRIAELVNSVKGFTFMDRAQTPEPIDIRRGITDTLTMLGAKIRAKGTQVTTRFADGLPCAHAVGAELNQVWMNLIDNALDAVAPSGHVTITADGAPGRVEVRITDDGPGIPADIKGRIFDPFFTTKGVGQGTGLGLDIVRRILRRHAGEVEVDSEPGRTEFRVILPGAR
jgi:signal transduction histidine kinase